MGEPRAPDLTYIPPEDVSLIVWDVTALRERDLVDMTSGGRATVFDMEYLDVQMEEQVAFISDLALLRLIEAAVPYMTEELRRRLSSEYPRHE
jgi:hypothetical protein